MRQHLILLASCVLTGGVALGIGYAWLTITNHATLPIPEAILCALVSVVLAMAVEHAVLVAYRRRTRSGPSRHRKPAA